MGNFGFKFGPSGNGREIAKSLNTLLAEAKGTPECDAFPDDSPALDGKGASTPPTTSATTASRSSSTRISLPLSAAILDTMVHRLLALYLDRESEQGLLRSPVPACFRARANSGERRTRQHQVQDDRVHAGQDRQAEYGGSISGLTEWGMYVGDQAYHDRKRMVALRDVKSDFFEFDEQNYLIRGRRTGKVFRLGDAVKIRVKCRQSGAEASGLRTG